MSELDRSRWNARYRELRVPEVADGAVNPFLVAAVSDLPTTGRVLDVAGGDGRTAVWLAGRGWDVTVADISAEALRRTELRAKSARVPIRICLVDLEVEPFPGGPWDLIVCVAYLHRPLFEVFAAELGRDGLLLVVQPTIRNLERFDRPSERYLLAEGELVRLLDGWTILRIEKGWRTIAPERHEARCLARKPFSSMRI